MQGIDAIREAVEEAQKYAAGEVSVDTVLKGLADGTRQAWSFGSFIVVTSVVVYESYSNLRVDYISGEMPDESMQNALSVLENFAEKVGCKGVEIIGRQGWVRKLRSCGYHQQYAVVIKRI